MPTYTYKCSNCLMEIDVRHSMSDVDNPSDDVQKETSCNENTCKHMSSSKVVPDGRSFQRVFKAPAILSFGHGSHGKGGLMSTAEKSKAFRERSDNDNKKNGVDEQKFENGKKIADKFK